MCLKRFGPTFACIVLVAIPSSSSFASTAAATMPVSATVLSVCTIAVQPLDFGNYVAATLDSTASLTVTCSLSTPFNVGLDVGTGLGASIVVRQMTNGSSTLAYTLSSDPAHSVNIGQTVGTDVLSGVGLGSAQTITIYGRVSPNQLVPPGIYTDTITATITY